MHGLRRDGGDPRPVGPRRDRGRSGVRVLVVERQRLGQHPQPQDVRGLERVHRVNPVRRGSCGVVGTSSPTTPHLYLAMNAPPRRGAYLFMKQETKTQPEDQEIEKWNIQLEQEGFREKWVHTDAPGYEYSEHTHPVDTTYVVLQGNMIVVVGGVEREVGSGDRFDVSKNTTHSAKVGLKGCTFLIGVKV